MTLQRSIYRYFWLCGLAASGKTMVLQMMKHSFPQLHCLSDSIEVLDFVRTDVGQQHHVKRSAGGFAITDSTPFQHAVRSLLKKIGGLDTALIELSRGRDVEGIVDLSYRSFFQSVPQEIKAQSLLIYVQSADALRFGRNSIRQCLEDIPMDDEFKSFHCPEDAMKRFFSADDFFSCIAAENTLDYIVLHNNTSAEHFVQRARRALV